MLLGQANKGKKRKNSGNTKHNLNKRAAISYANLSSSSSKYMSNLSKHSEFEEIEEEIEESSIMEQEESSIMEQNWSMFIEKLQQSSFWKEHEYSLNSMEKDIDAL